MHIAMEMDKLTSGGWLSACLEICWRDFNPMFELFQLDFQSHSKPQVIPTIILVHNSVSLRCLLGQYCNTRVVSVWRLEWTLITIQLGGCLIFKPRDKVPYFYCRIYGLVDIWFVKLSVHIVSFHSNLLIMIRIFRLWTFKRCMWPSFLTGQTYCHNFNFNPHTHTTQTNHINKKFIIYWKKFCTYQCVAALCRWKWKMEEEHGGDLCSQSC